jgi:hypothetical protein
MVDTADAILRRNLEKAREDIETSLQGADPASSAQVCPAHAGLCSVSKATANGVAVLLEIKCAEMDCAAEKDRGAAVNRLQFGDLSINGLGAIGIVACLACLYVTARMNGLF